MRNAKNFFLYTTIWAVLSASASLIGPSTCWSQKPAGGEEPPASPENVNLVTSDFVKLQCTYYPGKDDKETVPVILLHRWDVKEGRQEREVVAIAGYLQSKFGYAVLVPDVRGHGDSLKVVNGDEDLNRDRWRAQEIGAVVEDIEACKNFLIKKNNEGLVNIDLLSVVSIGETCLQAIAWSMRDWSYTPLGGVKQGQDVKALIMIDPVRSFKGLKCNDALKSPLFIGQGLDPLPVMVAAKATKPRDAKKISDNLIRSRKSQKHLEDQMVGFHKYSVEKQRNVVQFNKTKRYYLEFVVGDFIDKQVLSKKLDHRWQDRTRN